MKRKVTDLILVIVFIIGFSLLMYPIITTYVSKNKQNKVINEYINNIEKISDEEAKKMLDEANNYNTMLLAKGYKDLSVDGKKYNDILKTNTTDIMGYIEIEKLKVKLPIYHGVEDSTLQVGVGHWERSSFPVGGIGTHSVLMGHRGLPTSKLFTNLDKMKEGDSFKIHILKDELLYKVDQIKIVEPHELNDLKTTIDKDYVTLVTCTPYGINSHRLLVRGIRTIIPEIIIENGVFSKSARNITKYFVLCFGIVLLIECLIIFIYYRTRIIKIVLK